MPVTPARRPLTAAAACALLAAGAGCQGLTTARESAYDKVRSLITSSYTDPRADEKYAAAEQQFERGEFAAAQAVFGDLAENSKNPALLAEKARYMEAECLRERKKLPDAAATYHRLLQDHPYGAYRERSCNQMYAIAHGWLGVTAMKEIEAEQSGVTQAAWWEKPPPLPNFTDPARPLLDTEGEALEVLDNVYTHDPVGGNADKALFWLGYVHFYRGRYDDADYYLSQLVELHKDSKLRPEALKLAIVAKNNATGGAVYDSTKAGEALKLIQHAEATLPGYATDPELSAEMGRRKAEVRFQLAEKYMEQARYYERAGKPGSAYFYYDLVIRQHPGTRSAAAALERKNALETVKHRLETDRAAGKPEPMMVERVKQDWDRLWNNAGPINPDIGADDPADNTFPRRTPPAAGAPQVPPAAGQ